MNFHGKDIKIFTGSSNVDVAQGIAGCLGLPLGKSDCTQFSDGENLCFSSRICSWQRLLYCSVNLCSRQRQSYGNAHND